MPRHEDEHLPFEPNRWSNRHEPFRCTDYGNAERLVDAHGRDLRFVPETGWLVWDGKRWRLDADGVVMRRMKQTVRAIYREAENLNDRTDRKQLANWAIGSEAERRLNAAVKLAQTERQVVIAGDELDSDPWLLNVANGTVDLRTGALREHSRDDHLTKLASVTYDPHACHPLWTEFLQRITGNLDELGKFLQRAVGYSLTGLTAEEVLFFLHGPGATGKSSFIGALRRMMGDYAVVADFDTFLKRRGDSGVRNDLARLVGARLVVGAEVDEGKKLAEGLIKTLTGGDKVAVRHLYHEFFEFTPDFKLWLVANARPFVEAGDSAIWRRILLVPFTQVIPEADRDPILKDRLNSPDVQSAILTWAVEGCHTWQKQGGLAAPDCVRAYTDEYRAENDPLRGWVEDCVDLDANFWTSTDELHKSYVEWAEANAVQPVSASSSAWSRSLNDKGCEPVKRTARGWQGIRLRSAPHE